MDLEWSLDIAMLSIHHKTHFLEITICMLRTCAGKEEGTGQGDCGKENDEHPDGEDLHPGTASVH